MLLRADNIQKYCNIRLLFSIEKLQIYAGDRIGLIGDNGSGKTTLLSILSGDQAPDAGHVERRCEIGYIRQFSADAACQGKLSSEFNVEAGRENSMLSGGEATKARIVNALEAQRPLVFADEPTANLDIESVALFYEKFSRLETFVIVSHDRALLDRLCNRIWDLRDAALHSYSGNYTEYCLCRETEEKTAWREYTQYVSEKQRLTNIARERRRAAAKVSKKPKDPGKISDELTATRSKGGKQKALQRQAKSVEKHIEMLDSRKGRIRRQRRRWTLAAQIRRGIKSSSGSSI